MLPLNGSYERIIYDVSLYVNSIYNILLVILGGVDDMPKRETVKGVNIQSVESYLGSKGWSNAFFCSSTMGKGRGWISEWKRGKNLPSTEEAAKMCAVLQASPEELLCDPGDVEKVQKLLDEEAKKEQPVDRTELLSAIDRALFELTEEQKLEALRYIWSLQGKGEDND